MCSPTPHLHPDSVLPRTALTRTATTVHTHTTQTELQRHDRHSTAISIMGPPLFSALDISSICIESVSEFSDPKFGKKLKLVNKDGSRVQFTSPRLPLTWAANIKEGTEKSGAPNGQLSSGIAFSLNDCGKSAEFTVFLQQLREHLIDLVNQKVMTKMPRQVVEAFMVKLDRPPKKQGQSPTFVMKLPVNVEKRTITVPCFNAATKAVDPEVALTRGSTVIAHIELPYIHMSTSNTLTVRADALKCMVTAQAAPQEEFDFDIENDEELSAIVAEAMAKAKADEADAGAGDAGRPAKKARFTDGEEGTADADADADDNDDSA